MKGEVMRKLFRRVYYLLHRGRLERELEDEMAAHREMMPQDRRSSFGNTLRVYDEIRDAWGWLWLDHLRQDLLYASRGFIRERRFALSALAAIGLAVGAATAVFSVVDRSLFRPLPYYQGDRLVSVGIAMPLLGPGEIMFSGAYRDWQLSQSALDLTSWNGVGACDLGGESPQRLSCSGVDATFLPTLGVRTVLGRNFVPDEDVSGAEPVALLSFGLWQSNFGGDASVLGRSITVDGTLTRVIGVLPAEFEMPDLTAADLLVPQRLPPGKRNYQITVIGRLRPGTTIASAEAALTRPFQSFQADFGARVGSAFEKTMRLRLTTLREKQTRQYRLALWMLLGAVTAFVLIACTNVANLLLARSMRREQEFAIRAALGASRQRLICQTLAESGLLGLAGGAAGCVVAWGVLRTFVALAPEGTLRLREAGLDSRVLGFALILSVGTALLFGLAPALDRLRAETLGRAHMAGHRRTYLRQALITSQLSVSLILLTGAGLLLLSLWRLQNAPLGFDRERIVTASFTLPSYRYAEDSQQMNFFNQLETQLNALPGVLVAAIADSLPPGGGRTAPFVATAKPGGNILDPGMSGSTVWRYVTPGYFAALGIPVKRGRDFSDLDRRPGEHHVILSESLARRLYGDRDPIGERFTGGWPRMVVGVAGDARNAGLDSAPEPEFYVIRQTSREGIPGSGDPAWWRRATVIVRSTLSDRAAAESVRSAIQQLDPALPVKIEPMRSQVDHFLTRPRFQTALLSMFAFTGLILAALGLYGLICFLVADRTREIGVRIAVGATSGDVVKLVVADGVRWTVMGTVSGIAASAALSHLLQGLLYEVKVLDLRVFAGAITVLFLVALLASWFPAHRASQIDPVIDLRHD
jgi:putative ABC transport system permease protein